MHCHDLDAKITKTSNTAANAKPIYPQSKKMRPRKDRLKTTVQVNLNATNAGWGCEVSGVSSVYPDKFYHKNMKKIYRASLLR
jgi:hypothetical protein